MTQLTEQPAAAARSHAAVVRPCNLCGEQIRVVTDVQARRAVALNVPSPGRDWVYAGWSDRRGDWSRRATLWAWDVIQRTPPAAGAMAALDVEVNAPALSALESLDGFFVDHAATCRSREIGLAELCKAVAAALRGPMTRAAANGLAGALEAGAHPAGSPGRIAAELCRAAADNKPEATP